MVFDARSATNKAGGAGAGVAALWLGHLSPFTDQPPQFIFRAYVSATAGWLALICLVALMLALIVGALYAGYLWPADRGDGAALAQPPGNEDGPARSDMLTSRQRLARLGGMR